MRIPPTDSSAPFGKPLQNNHKRHKSVVIGLTFELNGPHGFDRRGTGACIEGARQGGPRRSPRRSASTGRASIGCLRKPAHKSRQRLAQRVRSRTRTGDRGARAWPVTETFRPHFIDTSSPSGGYAWNLTFAAKSAMLRARGVAASRIAAHSAPGALRPHEPRGRRGMRYGRAGVVRDGALSRPARRHHRTHARQARVITWAATCKPPSATSTVVRYSAAVSRYAPHASAHDIDKDDLCHF